jgi:DNA polymerase delta subunit 1
VYGFRPYFFVAAPSGFLNKDLEPLKDKLNVSCRSHVSGMCKADSKAVVGLTAVVSCTIFNRRSLWGYKGDEQVPFIKLTCTDQKAIPKVRDECYFHPPADL